MNNSSTTNISWKNFFYNRNVANGLWFGLAFLGIVLEVIHKTQCNNYDIFLGVYRHTIAQTNLYVEYPNEYHDVNLYGPLFSLVILPFYYLPYKIGVVCWVMFNASFLYFAIRSLPIIEKFQNAILVFSAHELMFASGWQQTNQLIAACIILGFTALNKNKEIWAAFFFLFATFIKLYGIVGFAFFFFSKDKLKLILWSIFWAVIFFLAPVILSSLNFILQSYYDWYDHLVNKAHKNVRMDISNDYQDISVMGMIRRVFHYPAFKNIWITIPAILLFVKNYIDYKNFGDIRYRLYMLCLVLLMTVIFTTSAEGPTYIIAFPAVCIWYVLQNKEKWITPFFVFALILTSFSYSDLLTPYVREHIVRPYSLKALPCFIMWCILIWQMNVKQFSNIDMQKIEKPFE